MRHTTLDEMAPLLVREASARRGTLLAIFAGVSLLFLVIGFLWQKKYTSYAQLSVDGRRVVAPLVGAETASTSDQAQIAREELFSNEILERILDEVDRGEMSRINDQLAQLQAEIDVLSLSCTDDYPDIVRLRQQMEDIRASARVPEPAAVGSSTFTLGGRSYTGAANLSPVYQELRSALARKTAEADALRASRDQLSALLEKEKERSSISSRVEREPTERTRDHQINEELYEDLLRRQESARLSMTLGAEKQGVLYRIVEPPNRSSTTPSMRAPASPRASST